MNKTILILTNNIGGLHSFRKEVVKAIVDAGYDVYISVPDDDGRVIFFQSIGCHIIKTTFNRRGMNPFADLKLLSHYRTLIKKLKPSAVLTYTIKPNVYGGIACRLAHAPQLANVTGLGDAIENGGWLQKLTLALYRYGVGKARCVFFQNASNRDFCLREGIATDYSLLLPGSGVNLMHHSFQPYPLDESTIKFLFIGRLLKDKGIEEYFDAARIIKAAHPNTEFQILGDCEGNYREELDELVKSGVVNYLGTTSDVRPFLTFVHCTIMPSYHEGMSNVNLESAANGRPVITTDVPGCRETVDDCISGFLVSPKSVNDLVRGIRCFLELSNGEKKAMGLNGRKKVEKEFDRQLVVDSYLRVINSLDSSAV